MSISICRIRRTRRKVIDLRDLLQKGHIKHPESASIILKQRIQYSIREVETLKAPLIFFVLIVAPRRAVPDLYTLPGVAVIEEAQEIDVR
jgi:hypothetical protein